MHLLHFRVLQMAYLAYGKRENPLIIVWQQSKAIDAAKAEGYGLYAVGVRYNKVLAIILYKIIKHTHAYV